MLKHVEFAMIYQSLFKSIPNNWIKIGVLHLGKRRITSFSSEVVFYALNQAAYKEIVTKLQDFLKTLPEDVVFTFEENRG